MEFLVTLVIVLVGIGVFIDERSNGTSPLLAFKAAIMFPITLGVLLNRWLNKTVKDENRDGDES